MLPSLETLAMAPQDFAFGAPVRATKPAAAYRVVLPLAVYQRTVREDLGDLRVFNDLGESAPYLLNEPVAAAVPAVSALPIFPLPSGSRPVIDGIRLSIDTTGAAMHWQAQKPRGENAPGQYILDGRGLEGLVDALVLQWADSAADYSGRMRVEVSDDLDAWRVVATAQVTNLRADGHSLVQNRIALGRVRAQFWRLSWFGSAPGLALTGVSAESAQRAIGQVRDVVDVAAVRDPVNANEYRFDLGAHVPVDRVGVSLPEANTVLDLAFDSRARADGAWHPVVRSAFTRVGLGEADHQTAPLSIAVDRARYWRVRVLGGDATEYASMKLHVEWVPDEVTFLARGHGPYVLAYGNAVAEGNAMKAELLPTRLAIEDATLGESTELGGAQRLKAVAAPLARRRMALWGVLLIAVAGLGWMSYRLVKEGARGA